MSAKIAIRRKFKICPCCRKIFKKSPKAPYKEFFRIKYCSRKCAGQKVPRDSSMNIKQCVCGKLFSKPPNYSYKKWDERKTCSNQCSHKNLSLQTRLEHILANTIATPTGCMECQSISTKRYSETRCFGKQIAVHRLVWVLLHGDIPEGICVLHSCDNTKCVNPEHLFSGTQLDNIKDRDQKGRQSHKLSKEDKAHIIKMIEKGIFQKNIASEFSVSQALISKIRSQYVSQNPN